MTMHLKPADRFSGSGSLGYVYNMNIEHHEAETLTDKKKKLEFLCANKFWCYDTKAEVVFE